MSQTKKRDRNENEKWCPRDVSIDAGRVRIHLCSFSLSPFCRSRRSATGARLNLARLSLANAFLAPPSLSHGVVIVSYICPSYIAGRG